MEADSSDPGGTLQGSALFFVNLLLQGTYTAGTLGIVLGFVVIALLIISSALISGSETAYFSLTSKEVDKLRAEGKGAAERVLLLLQKPRTLLATILIVNNLVNVAIVLISYFLFVELTANTLLETNKVLGFFVNTIAVTFLLVLLGEVFPKVYANKFNERMSLFMSLPLALLTRFFSPVSRLMVRATTVIERRLERHRQDNDNGSFDLEELEQAIDLTTGPKSTKQEVDMLKGIVKFGNTAVRQIMRSRMDMVAVEENISYTELLAVVEESGFSRIPVYRDTLDSIIGVLYVKDLLAHLNEEEDFKWTGLLRPPTYVPENKKIDDLLKEIQQTGVHLVIAVDEYGGVSGLVTLEDILEEVIGEIKDEYDVAVELDYKKLDDKNFVFEGKTLINDICKVLGYKEEIFDDVRGDADSLAGLVLELAGHIPVKNEEINYHDFLFKVLEVGNNRIEKVKITIKDDEDA